MTPAGVVGIIQRSGLRGRGGGGYPAGMKWSLLAKAQSDQKSIIANGDEGDPGAYMDRTVMEDDPHRVLEGMAIAAFATGAVKGYIYVRAEYPVAVRRLEQAIRQAKRHKLLGKNLFGGDFSFDVEIRIGAGAFVCGEETALMASIMGQRGTPVLRPPYPTERGLWGEPSMINNVETLANVPTILRRGPDWFADIGTENSRGTKVFALAGKLQNTGLIEVPMGITLREIVEEIGGGVPGGKAFKAAQTGGPSGGCIPVKHIDTQVDYDSLMALGSIMGSGGLIVMDEDVKMPEVARFFMHFCMDESCGKCLPCRAGTHEMHELLEALIGGRGTAATLARLETLCDVVRTNSLCGLGQTAPNPVLSTLHYFRSEYEALIVPEGAHLAGLPGLTRSPPPHPALPAPAPAPGRGAPDGRRQPEDRRHRGRGPRGREPHASRRPRRRPRSPACANSTASRSWAPAACAWWRWPAPRSRAPPAPRRSASRWTSAPTPHGCASTAACCCRCSSPRASTSAPCASPAGTASCRRWPPNSAWTTSTSRRRRPG
jgi:bidirectional [NiFe] hydrogenase diaphorase subunit